MSGLRLSACASQIRRLDSGYTTERATASSSVGCGVWVIGGWISEYRMCECCQQPGLTLANDPVTSEPFDWTGSPIGTRQCAPHASAVEYVDPENDTASGPDLSHTTPSTCTVYPHEATSASCGGDTSTAIPSPALSMMAVSVPCADTAVATITKRASAIAMYQITTNQTLL
jgi:hypothetical protein